MSGGKTDPSSGAMPDIGRWIAICKLEAILPDTGVAALVAGRQIAVFRVGHSARVYALQNFDPFSKAFVLSRGIVGDRGGTPKVASPIFKQSFALETGQCLDDATVKLRTYPARVVDGRVEIFDPKGTRSS